MLYLAGLPVCEHTHASERKPYVPYVVGLGSPMPFQEAGISSLLISTLPVHLPTFFLKPLPMFPVFAMADTWFLCGPTEENRPPCRMQVPRLSARGI